MAQAEKIMRRRDETTGIGLRAVLAAQESSGLFERPIPRPSNDAEEVLQTCDSFTFASFTANEAWELGHLLYARLLKVPGSKPTVISITSAQNDHVLFQAVVGSGTQPDNDIWVARKRKTVLRFGTSTWYQHCKYNGDESAFRKKFGMSEEMASAYAIHGGGVPIRVSGVEGIVAVVVVSGLAQHEDHGVIVEVINKNWQLKNPGMFAFSPNAQK
ncbi:hypothetical protein GGS20DRAFT_584891 [Poronia punctata]|nr:hypothetical protein GGS20DRAFT_584891 [Poronia punctata]